jgi:hypothetical protein
VQTERSTPPERAVVTTADGGRETTVADVHTNRGLASRVSLVAGVVLALSAVAVAPAPALSPSRRPGASVSSRVGALFTPSSSDAWASGVQVADWAPLTVSDHTTAAACSSSGNCAIGGSANGRAFVRSEVDGVWLAPQFPSTDFYGAGDTSEIDQVACPADGECTAVGTFTSPYEDLTEPFVNNQIDGVWGYDLVVPGILSLTGGLSSASIASVSCPAEGSCAVAGGYEDASHHHESFVDAETNQIWGSAIEVPGTAALNVNNYGSASAISCPAAGTCVVGGSYEDAAYADQAYVATETSGVWASAIEVPGTAALNAAGYAGVGTISCPQAGYCTLGGYFYLSSDYTLQAFVATEAAGVWSAAIAVPGIEALNVSSADAEPLDGASFANLFCDAPGSCTADGDFVNALGQVNGYVATETAGVWADAQAVPGLAALGASGSDLDALSCWAAAHCALGGSVDTATGRQAMVLNLLGPSLGDATEVPGAAALNPGGTARVNALACASDATCVAVGTATDAHGDVIGLLATSSDATWSPAGLIADLLAQANADSNSRAAGTDPSVTAMSCPATGDCLAGGAYSDGAGSLQPFVDVELDGTWGPPEPLAGMRALNTGGVASVSSVSCASVGDCTVGGYFTGTYNQPFLATLTDGVWAAPFQVPGVVDAANEPGGADVTVVSCPSAGNCTAGGFSSDADDVSHAFVIDEVAGTWGTAQLIDAVSADSRVTTLDCPSAGDCVVGGDDELMGVPEGVEIAQDAFLATEVGGTWSAAVEPGGLSALDVGYDASLSSVSCSGVGDCSAVGTYGTVPDETTALDSFVIDDVSGTWGTAHQIPGTATLAAGGVSWGILVSCPASGDCTLAGAYGSTSGSVQLFVATRSQGAWSAAVELPGVATINDGPSASVTSLSCAGAGDCVVAGDVNYNAGTFTPTGDALVADELGGVWQSPEVLDGYAATATSCAPSGACAAGGWRGDPWGIYQAFLQEQTTDQPTSVALGSSGSPSDPGEPVTFTATVTGSDDAGTVTFSDTSPLTGCENVPLDASGVATCTTADFLEGGPNDITAAYSGDETSGPSLSPTLTQVVTMPATTTTLQLPGTTPWAGQVATYAAHVGGADGGSVTFLVDGAAPDSCPYAELDSSRTATCSFALSAGTHSIVAQYLGDDVFAPSQSSAQSETLLGAATSVTLSAPSSSLTYRASVHLTAKVSGSDGGGTVAFSDGSHPVNGCGAVALGTSGSASCLDVAPVAGAHSFQAAYSGDASSAASSSARLVITVARAPTSLKLTATPTRVAPKKPVVLSAVITPSGVSGRVTFSWKGGSCAASLVASRARCTVRFARAGTYPVSASYPGGANYRGSSTQVRVSVT